MWAAGRVDALMGVNTLSKNNSRKAAARRIQAQNPGMPYEKAWVIAGLAHDAALGIQVNNPDFSYEKAWDLALVVVDLDQTVQRWEGMLAEADKAADRMAVGPQTRFHDHVAVRYHGYGRPTAVEITPEALDRYSAMALGDVVTSVAQRSWDSVVESMGVDVSEIQSPPGRESILTESSADGSLVVSVDSGGRMLECVIAVGTDAQPWWLADVLSAYL